MNYSGDEGFVLFLGGILAVFSWATWFYRLAATGTRVRRRGRRLPLAVVPLFCAILLYFVLDRWSAEDVRNDPAYMFFYMMVGLGWIGLKFNAPELLRQILNKRFQ